MRKILTFSIPTQTYAPEKISVSVQTMSIAVQAAPREDVAMEVEALPIAKRKVRTPPEENAQKRTKPTVMEKNDTPIQVIPTRKEPVKEPSCGEGSAPRKPALAKHEWTEVHNRKKPPKGKKKKSQGAEDKGGATTEGEEVEKWIVEKAIGDKDRVKTLQQRLTLELRSLHPFTGEKHLIEDLANDLKLETGDILVKNIRSNNNDGTRTGIFTVPASKAIKIKEGECIKMGYVISRIKIVPDILRCYRYHHLGHIATQCKATIQGKEICRRCGEQGHEMASCKVQARCVLCAEANLLLNRLGHVAGAITCPQYKDALERTIARAPA